MGSILAIDQGTTSSRAMVINHAGAVTAVAQREFCQIFPLPGWVEHNPQEIWSTQMGVIAEVLAHSGISPREIAAIGITNQRETTLLWDRRTGQPLANAIVWQDRRTAEFCHILKQEGLEPTFRQKTGLLLDPYFSATKLHWLLHNIPGAMQRAQRGELAFGTVDTWLVWKLTGGTQHVTDVSNASRTLMFNIHTRCWDEEILSLLGIPVSLLPRVASSSEIYGETNPSLLSPPIPIAGIAGDQQAALFGQTCFSLGKVKTTYGTGCFMLMNTGSKPIMSKNNLLTTIAYQIKEEVHYALEGSVFMGGAVVQWLRDNLHIIEKASDIQRLAASVPDNHGVYFVPAFTGLGAPYWDPYARGMILGLSRGTQVGHIARAAIEGIGFQVNDLLRAMESDADLQIEQLRVDGGAVHDDLLMQFQADLLGVPVIRPKTTELTGIGAAFLAGLAVGFWKDQKEISSYWQEDKVFLPRMPQEKVSRLIHNWKQAVHCAQQWKD